MTPQDLEFIRQQHEVFLSDLEALSVQALASGNWDEVLAHINQVRLVGNDLSDRFNSQEDFFAFLTFINQLLIVGEASTKDLSRPGADSFSQPTE